MSELRRIEIGLLVLRIGIAVFFFGWASLKFLRPEWAKNIWTNAYKLPGILEAIGSPFAALLSVEPATAGAYVLGVLQVAFVAAFAAGWRPSITYLVLLIMHTPGTISIIPNLIRNLDKYPTNLMLTSISTWAALFTLWFLRRHDRLLSLSGRMSRPRKSTIS